MPRRTAASATTAAIPPHPTTVAERRRALRDAKGLPTSGTRKVEIDLAKPGARRALTALYPRPENDTMLAATPELEAAALAYIEARDAATLASEKKEIAGNVLCNAIGRNRGIVGAGWKAEWDMSKGSVDWTELARELNIADDTIAKHRKPEARSLTVREIADES
jgi:hypothetical protein